MMPGNNSTQAMSGMQPGMNGTSGVRPSGMAPTNSTSGMMPGMNGTSGFNPSGMMPGMNGTSGIRPSGSQPAPQLGQLNLKSAKDELSSYFVAGGCAGGKRFVYSEASMTNSGNAFDYLDKSPQQGGIGAAISKKMNDCGKAFAGASAADKQNCRGDMNSQCANSLDQTCKNSGLYDQIQGNPQSASAYPDACNSGLTGYSDQACFNWIENNLVKGTIVFDFRGFKRLPDLIYRAITANTAATRLRYLQTVAASDPTKTDTKAQVSGSISDSDLTVDSATATKIPDANAYVTNLNTVTTATSIPDSGSSNFISVSFSLVLIAVFGLFM